MAAQTTVESDSPREADLVLSDEPLLRIGMLDGPEEYLFGNISGAVRLGDGSVVVADEQGRHVRMFEAGGEHVWTSGREGEGPGEYRGLWLLRGCPGAAVTVYDWRIKRITELDSDGSVVDTRGLRGADGPGPYGAPACSPGGDLVFTDWPEAEEDLAVGEFRWEMSLSWERDDAVATLRSGIPGTDLYHHGGGISGPVTWGKDMAFAVAATGVWYGSADDYQLEHVDWTGRVTRVPHGGTDRISRSRANTWTATSTRRWHVLRRPRSAEASRRKGGPGIRDGLPERFPAFAAKGLLPLSDGSVWVVPHSSRDLAAAEFHLLGRGWRVAPPPHHPGWSDPPRRRSGLGAVARGRRVRRTERRRLRVGRVFPLARAHLRLQLWGFSLKQGGRDVRFRQNFATPRRCRAARHSVHPSCRAGRLRSGGHRRGSA